MTLQSYYLRLRRLARRRFDRDRGLDRKMRSSASTRSQRSSHVRFRRSTDGRRPGGTKPSLERCSGDLHADRSVELIVFAGQPNFIPSTASDLLWAANTNSDVLVETTTNNNYVACRRWFNAPALIDPWSFVASNGLPGDFSKFRSDRPPGVFRPLQERPSAGSADRQFGATNRQCADHRWASFDLQFDGDPQYAPIPERRCNMSNSSLPIVQVSTSSFYGLTAGIWFTAATVRTVGGRTVHAGRIYTIPTSSPIHYVTYVKVYG